MEYIQLEDDVKQRSCAWADEVTRGRRGSFEKKGIRTDLSNKEKQRVSEKDKSHKGQGEMAYTDKKEILLDTVILTP